MAYATRELWEVLIAFADMDRVNPMYSANSYRFKSGRQEGEITIEGKARHIPGFDRQCFVHVEYGTRQPDGQIREWTRMRIRRFLESPHPAFLSDEEHELLQEIASTIIRKLTPPPSAQADEDNASADAYQKHLVSVSRLLRNSETVVAPVAPLKTKQPKKE